MKTLTKQQQKVLGDINLAKQSLAYKSLVDILENGYTTTGKSGYSGGYASRHVWTHPVSVALTQLGIQHECGNDAPRGGANGEFVKITDKRFLNRIKKYKLQLAEEMAAAEVARLAKEKAETERVIAFINSLPANDAFELKWNSVEFKNESGLSWSGYRQMLKQQFPAEWEILKAKFKAKQMIY